MGRKTEDSQYIGRINGTSLLYTGKNMNKCASGLDEVCERRSRRLFRVCRKRSRAEHRHAGGI